MNDSSFSIGVYFTAQTQYVRLDGVGKRIGVPIPDMLQYRGSGKDRAFVSK
jgi:hypothetical protein